MAKLSVISDGISEDLATALGVSTRAGVPFVELQSVWGKPVGELSATEVREVRRLTSDAGVEICCLSHKNLFGALPVLSTAVGDESHDKHMNTMRRVLDIARETGARSVRIMCFRKESVLFGSSGAESAVVTRGAWARFVELMRPPVELAERERVQLVVENSTKGMVTSAFLARKLVDEIGSPALKVLWDPCNALYFNERPFPDGYDCLRGGYLGHMHIKDSIADIPRARIDFAPLGKGAMGPYLPALADALRAEGYDGFVSLESIYRTESGDPNESFRASVDALKNTFGAGRNEGSVSGAQSISA
jgi:sugar phosphate isomerase/epimerase